MGKTIVGVRGGLVFFLVTLVFCSGALAMSDRGMIDRRDNRGDNRGDNRRDDQRDNRKEERHYYRDGRWYKHDSRGQEVSVADIVIGAIAESLPPQHTTVVIRETPYYYDNSHYYKQLPDGGFVVVAPPRR